MSNTTWLEALSGILLIAPFVLTVLLYFKLSKKYKSVVSSIMGTGPAVDSRLLCRWVIAPPTVSNPFLRAMHTRFCLYCFGCLLGTLLFVLAVLGPLIE